MQADDMPDIPTTVQLDKVRLAGGIGSLLGLLWVVWAYTATRGAGSMLVIVTLFCLVGAFYAFIGLGKAPCPDCGMMKSGVGLKHNDSLECVGCGSYYNTRDGEVFATAEDAVETFPAFGTACPKNIEWPAGCCVCQQTVTRTVPITLELEEDSPIAQDMLTRAATLGTFKLVSKRLFEVQIPVCPEHGSDAAELEFRYDEAQLHIRFRSRSYAAAFEEANGPVFWDS